MSKKKGRKGMEQKKKERRKMREKIKKKIWDQEDKNEK